MSEFLDFRSDTLTQPTLAMRKAMADAVVGDSFYDEDPSVNALETRIAELFAHEAALFVPTGTMSNQIAIQLHCRHGESVLASHDLHILRAETGGISALAGAQPIAVRTTDDFLPQLDSLEELFVPSASIVAPPTRLLATENTHLFSGGRIHSFEHLQQLAHWCTEKKIAFHLDGARLWHAHIETKIPLSAYGALFDTLSVCFSKGLGAPAGSCLIGSKEHIKRAKLIRKRLGGSMRQCGILAAAASYSLDHHLKELKFDHEKAKLLAQWLRNKFPQAEVREPETNIVLLRFATPAERLIEQLKAENGIILSMLNQKTLRAVCHRDIPQDKLDALTSRS